MDPHTGKLMFTIGIFIFIFSLIPLPFLQPGSAEFVIDILALILSLAILGYVILNVRKQALLDKQNLTGQQRLDKETLSKKRKIPKKER